MARLTVTLNDGEKSALWHLAERERRDPRDQAALIIRRELERVGLLPVDATATEPAQPTQPIQPEAVKGGEHEAVKA